MAHGSMACESATVRVHRLYAALSKGHLRLISFSYAGEYEWPEGHKFAGMWADRHQEGEGEYHWTDGRKYKGEWSGIPLHRSQLSSHGLSAHFFVSSRREGRARDVLLAGWLCLHRLVEART